MQSFIEQYGYVAVLLGTFLEGETILILGGLAAHMGYLDLRWVIMAAFLGTLLGDQLYFFLGRRHGQDWLNKRPHWQKRSKRVLKLMERHQTLLILGFRFLYGLRTITPFVIGMSHVSIRRFILLNIIGALIWAVVIGVSGYLFGNAFELVIGKVKHYEVEMFVIITFVGITAYLVMHYLVKKK